MLRTGVTKLFYCKKIKKDVTQKQTDCLYKCKIPDKQTITDSYESNKEKGVKREKVQAEVKKKN